MTRTWLLLVALVASANACSSKDLTIGRDRDASNMDDPAPPGSALSCQATGPGLSDCGPNAESCCTSAVVPGGMFYRGYDGVSFTDMGSPAQVSGFRLDKYEITVGRFRQFVGVVVAGWRPPAGGGKHAHLNGGQGLADVSSGGFEPGWNGLWNNNLFTAASGWDAGLSCQSSVSTWTPSAGANENLPIACVNWYQAYAFCIWDGGFLPSESEWNYAASGGDEQRSFPWSVPPSARPIDCTYANHNAGEEPGGPCTLGANNVGSESPKGDGRWGQADLAGNVCEWNLDWYANFAVPCADCVYLTGLSEPVLAKLQRGGSFQSQADGPGQSPAVGGGSGLAFARSVLTSDRVANSPTVTQGFYGARCARAP